MLANLFIGGGTLYALWEMGLKNLFGGEQTLEDLMQHSHTTGKAGMGKSTRLRREYLKSAQRIVEIITKIGNVTKVEKKKCGCLFIDPHGIDSEKLLNEIPTEDIERVIYINAADIDYPVGMQLYESAKGDLLSSQVSVDNILSIFGYLWKGFIGPNTSDILTNASLAVVEQEISTLLETYLVLSDDEFYKKLKVTNPIVLDFFERVMPNLSAGAKNPPENKLRGILSKEVMLMMLCQSKPKFNLIQAMEEGKLVICNFSKKVGEITSSFLGATMVSQIEISGFKRQEDSLPFFCYFDEWENYVLGGENISNMLSELRKFRVSVNLFNQFCDQIPQGTMAAIAGNCSSRYTFKIGETDARRFGHVFAPYTEEELMKLPKYTYISKRIVNGKDEEARERRDPPPPKVYGHGEEIKERCRRVYGTPRAEVMADITRRIKAASERTVETGGGNEGDI